MKKTLVFFAVMMAISLFASAAMAENHKFFSLYVKDRIMVSVASDDSAQYEKIISSLESNEWKLQVAQFHPRVGCDINTYKEPEAIVISCEQPHWSPVTVRTSVAMPAKVPGAIKSLIAKFENAMAVEIQQASKNPEDDDYNEISKPVMEVKPSRPLNERD